MSYPRCHQINLQRHFLGGEVFTVFFTRALAALECPVTLYVSGENPHWRRLHLPGAELVPLRDDAALPDALPGERSLVVTNGPVATASLGRLAQRHALAGFVHMPMYERDCSRLDAYHLVCAVSRHVLHSLEQGGAHGIYPEPFYGVADFDRFGVAAAGGIVAHSPYLWDKRKFRDVLFGLIEPLGAALKPRRVFSRLPWLTLGIVSGLAPIKQFPLLFRHIAPVIARYPQVRLEIFGDGGYAQVRDVKRALTQLAGQTRFWGMQDDPQRIYPQLDYLLSGLPEKEALGLNLIEAQVCGTPVIAVDAPPFTETTLDGRSGFLYRDPRQDGGRDFERILRRALDGPRPDPREALDHLSKFSFDAFKSRVASLLDHVVSRFGLHG